MRWLKKIRDDFTQLKEESFGYFRECQNEIKEENAVTLKKVIILYALFLSSFFIGTLLAFRSQKLGNIYCIFLVIHLLFSVSSLYFFYEKKVTYKQVQIRCMEFLVLMMIFNVVMNTFSPFQRAGIFFPIILTTGVTIFIFRYYEMFLYILVSGGCFLTTSYFLKDITTFQSDVFMGITGMVVASMVYYNIFDRNIRKGKLQKEVTFLSNANDEIGTFNRSTTEYFCKNYLETAKGEAAGVMYLLSLDEFELVEKQQGEEKASNLLKDIANSLKASFRGRDVIGRYSEYNFLIFLKGMKTKEEALSKAKQIKNIMVAIKGKYKITSCDCNMGIGLYEEGDTYEDLFFKTKKALYQSKENGANQVVFYDKNLFKKEKPVMLVVDDSKVSRQIIEKIFSEEYQILQAGDGEEALISLRKNWNRVDVILLDIYMPKMNGYQVLEEISKDEILKRIPVLVITSDADNELKALEMGARDLMVKPFEPLVIKKRVANAIEKAEKE